MHCAAGRALKARPGLRRQFLLAQDHAERNGDVAVVVKS
jgi:hypothetical protein